MLKIKNIDFYKSFSINSEIKTNGCPEIAFLGRSNVGKSSLINDICNRRIAFTSQTPGKTRLINYFLINNEFYFVDLPGYGYAQVSKSEKKDWPKMIEQYLSTSQNLRKIFFLLDIRRDPNDMDLAINNWIKKLQDIEVFYILTKYDKLSKQMALKQKLKIALSLMVDQKDFIYYSVPKKIGKIDILKIF